MSLGAVVLGLLNGLTIGLLAVGLVLVYKSNRFLNLAHAQLGTLSALLLAKWVNDWGWSWWIAFPLAVAVGIGTGILVERLLVSRLRRKTRSPIRLLLLSVGVSQLLIALTYIPDIGPNIQKTNVYPQPFRSDLQIGNVSLTGMYVLTALLVPVLVGALAAFLRYSSMGKQIRAAANNPDAARLCGISVDRVSVVTWALAGGFSAVSAVLQAPTQSGFNVAALGPLLLMLTLGAAAFGAFVSVPGALAGGLALGLVSQLVSAHTSSAPDAEIAVFLLTLAIVFVRGRAIAQVFSLTGPVAEEHPVTRVPAHIRDHAFVRRAPLCLGATALLAAIVWPQVPYFDTTGNQFSLALILIYAVIGVSLTMLVGWAGQVSLGHFALVGLGAYLTGQWSDSLALGPLFLVVGSIAAATMVVVGLPALRVRGLTLAVTTLGFAVISGDWLFRQTWLATDRPTSVLVEPARIASGLDVPSSQLAIYYVALVVLVLAVLAAGALRRSTPGRMFLAVRDNERASAAFGISPAAVKLAVLGVSGFFAGVAGVLWAEAWKSLAPIQFTPDISIAIIAIPVIGGLGSLGGAVAAAVLLYAGTFFVGPHVQGLFGDFGQNLGFSLFLAGGLMIFTLLRLPSGLAGLAQQWWQRHLDWRGAREERLVRGMEPSVPLRVRGVRLSFGGVLALDEPDVAVHDGEIVGLIGTNGAGKTTLMNVVSGVLRPAAGSVQLFGHEVIDLPPDFRAAYGLARSFQDASLFAGLTVRETIQVAFSQHEKVGVVSALVGAPWVRAHERRMRTAADEILERFGLTPWAEAHAAELSTGTRRICDLAAQVAARPKIILLDEPTAGVAQREAEAFGPLLRRIRDELDCSVLIVEHDMPLLMELCDRIYALEAGAVIAEGTPEQIRNDPRVVASYLGTEETAIGRSGTGAKRAPRKQPVRAQAAAARRK